MALAGDAFVLVWIIVSVGMLLAFSVHRRLEESRKGLIDQSTMTRLIIFDCIGILLVLVSAMVVGSLVSKSVGTAVFTTLQAFAPQWAEIVAIVSSLLVSLAAAATTVRTRR